MTLLELVFNRIKAFMIGKWMNSQNPDEMILI